VRFIQGRSFEVTIKSPEFVAQAGGPDKNKIPAALEQAYEVIAQKVKG
jgi:hypothetical protein